MRYMALVIWQFALFASSFSVPDAIDNCVYLIAGDTLNAVSYSGEATDWYFALPVREHYGNMIPGGEPLGLGVDTLSYSVFLFSTGVSEVNIVIEEDSVIPFPGVFYLMADPPAELRKDTLFEAEPLHHQYPDYIIQVVSRTSDDYSGYLSEMINTPFLMTPRLTAKGYHQAEQRLGCDCSGFAVYAARRAGRNIPYSNPTAIVHT